MTNYPDIRFRKKEGGAKVDWFEVVEPCLVRVVGPTLTIIIPAGYVTNFASIPRFFWLLIAPHGLIANGAVVHDFMYESRAFEDYLDSRSARLLADTIFLANMKQSGVRAFHAYFFYLAIRAFGRSWWMKNPL